jgi:predicted metal-dependent peptidase
VGKAPANVLYDPALSKEGEESCVEIYAKMLKGRKIIVIPTFDLHLRPSRKQVKLDKGRREQTIIAAEQLHSRLKQGKLPGSLVRQVQEIITPKVNWEDHLRTVMTRKAGTKVSDWSKQNRRLAGRTPQQFYAGIKRKGAGPIVGVGDNSGSITAKMTGIFAGGFAGIVDDLHPERLIVLWCDAAVTRCDEVEEPLDLVELFAKWKKEGVGGGGGTDFRPVFKEVEKMGLKPDMLVFFTDGHGTFPRDAPAYPVVWAMTTSAKPPFGEVVRVDVS